MLAKNIVATIVACSMSFAAAAPVDIKGREPVAEAKPGYGTYGDYGAYDIPSYTKYDGSATSYGTYGDYGSYKEKRETEAAPVEKREAEAAPVEKREPEPKADAEAKPQYDSYGAYDIPSYATYDGAPTDYGTYGDYGAYKKE